MAVLLNTLMQQHGVYVPPKTCMSILITNNFIVQIIIVPPEIRQEASLAVRNFNLIKHSFYATHKSHFFSSEPHQYAN